MQNINEGFQRHSAPEDADSIPDQAFCVCWYGHRIGKATITDGGLTWNGFASESMKKLFGELLPSREEDGMPQFLVNLEPEHEIFSKIGIKNKEDYLSTGLRFLSNLLISRNGPFDLPVTHDALIADLDNFIDESGVFDGRYISTLPASYDSDDLEKNLSRVWENRYAPRYSGQEIKIPVTLDAQGHVSEAIGQPFTHFLKLPTAGAKEGWGTNEWMCMKLSEAAGLPTAKHALINLSDDLAPAYIVERFDIDRSSSSTQKQNNTQSLTGEFNAEETNSAAQPRKILQDFCTLAGMRPLKGLKATKQEGLAAGTMEKVGKIAMQYSSDPVRDAEMLLKRTLVSYTVGDSDMHRKNISMIFELDIENGQVLSANMSPAYDITSEIHEDERMLTMTLPVNGKNNKLKEADFVKFAGSMGIDEQRASDIIQDTMTSIAAKAVEICHNLPDIVTENSMCHYTAHRIATIAVNRTKAFGFEVPDWHATDRIKISGKRQQELPEQTIRSNAASAVLKR